MKDPIDISDTAKSAVIQTVSYLYTGKSSENVGVRYEMFSKKGFSSEKLTSTANALQEHMKMVNYQSFIWKSATKQFLFEQYIAV